MKKIILFLFCYCLFTTDLFAQTTLKYPVKGKQITLDVQEATIAVEGYDGDDLIVEPDPQVEQKTAIPGFSLISSGLAGGDDLVHAEVLKDDGNYFSLRLLSVFNNGLNFRHWHILVPKNAHLKVVFIISELNAKMSFKNLHKELEIEGTAPFIEFNDITGPLTLSEGASGHRIGGTEKVTISHLQIPKSSTVDNEDTPLINIITGYGDVDIALPETVAATIQVDALNGNLYSNLNMVQQRPAYPIVKGRYTGNLNGGGKMIAINATNGNVYLRKEK